MMIDREKGMGLTFVEVCWWYNVSVDGVVLRKQWVRYVVLGLCDGRYSQKETKEGVNRKEGRKGKVYRPIEKGKRISRV